MSEPHPSAGLFADSPVSDGSVIPPAVPPQPPHSPRTRGIIIGLLSLAIVAAIAVGVYLTGKGDAPAASASPTAQTSQPAAQPDQQQSQSAPAGPAAGSAQPTSAPSQTDPAIVQILHDEQHRDPADQRALGDVDADVVMVVYSDFACPFCTRFAQEVEPTLQDLIADGTLRIEWRDLAQITETSPLAAQAGLAASYQGKFWEFHNYLYQSADPNDHPEYTEASLIEAARQAGVPDIDQFSVDMTAATTIQDVEQARDHAYSLGISGTPFFIVGDAVIAGLQDSAFVRATIMEQAAHS